MPIVEPAPWRRQYFEGVACPADVWIPADDPEAWAWSPEHRWVFDKLQVALSQGLEAAPHGVMPRRFPVFSKPIINLGGMGAGSRVICGPEDYRPTPGHMWSTMLEGRHVSTDLAVVDGEPRWWRHATGAATADGMFDHWIVHAENDPEIEARCGDWVRRHLRGYTGMLNVETIGGTIIEAHLRFSDQWPDLYGAGWVEALVGLYRDRAWRFADDGRRQGFSVILFGPHGRRYRHPPAALADQVRRMPGISSLQISFHEDKRPEDHAMPPGGFRLAIINAWELDRGRAARERLAAHFLTGARPVGGVRAIG